MIHYGSIYKMGAALDITTLDISEARKQFNTMDERLETEPVIFISRHNKTAFAVINCEYLSAMMETLEIMSDPESHRMFLQSLEDVRQGRTHDHEDIKRELG